MSQPGYNQCGCCGNLYRSDGSEDQLYDEDHDVEYTTRMFWWSGGEFGYGLAPGETYPAASLWVAILWMIGELA